MLFVCFYIFVMYVHTSSVCVCVLQCALGQNRLHGEDIILFTISYRDVQEGQKIDKPHIGQRRRLASTVNFLNGDQHAQFGWRLHILCWGYSLALNILINLLLSLPKRILFFVISFVHSLDWNCLFPSFYFICIKSIQNYSFFFFQIQSQPSSFNVRSDHIMFGLNLNKSDSVIIS